MSSIKYTPLHKAARNGAIEMAKKLLCQKDTSVNCKDCYGKTPLHYASEEGRLDMIKMLVLEYNADIDLADSSGKTALHYACELTNTDKKERTIRLLISDLKANVNCTDLSGRTPLYYAYQSDMMDVAKLLASELKADINCTDCDGKTALHHACTAEEMGLVKTFVSKLKADVNSADSKGLTPLHYACMRNQVKVVRVLLDLNASVKCTDNDGWMPLHYACISGHLDCARLIASKMKFDSDIDCPDTDGNTLLHYACAKGNKIIVDFLVDDHELKASVHCPDLEGKTPLHHASAKGHLSIVERLLENSTQGKVEEIHSGTGRADSLLSGLREILGSFQLERCFKSSCETIDVDCADNTGKSPLYYACAGGHVDVVKLLVTKFKVDVNYTDADHRNLLHYACSKAWDIDVVKALFKAEVFNCADYTVKTPLHYACTNRNWQIVKLLLPYFKNDDRGWTPLHIACAQGYLQLVIVLKSSSKDMVHPDAEGRSPLMLAALGGHINVVKTMLGYYKCPVATKDKYGSTLLHLACRRGSADLVKLLVTKYKLDIKARNGENNTTLHVAALAGQKEVIDALLKLSENLRLQINIAAKGKSGMSLLHAACAGGNASVVKYILEHAPRQCLMVDDSGNTPLHICASSGYQDCVRVLLSANAPVLMRNHSGQRPEDVATFEVKAQLKDHIEHSKEKVYFHYDAIQKFARRRYSGTEHVARCFVVGDHGTGKSSLIQSLTREGLLESYKAVSKASLPPYSDGIIPSVYVSRHYRRLLFYDFAGEAQSYSTRDSILTDLAASSKGDNIFLIVVDIRSSERVITASLNMWAALIQQLKFNDNVPSIILVGSHADLINNKEASKKSSLLRVFSKNIQPRTRNSCQVAHVLLDSRQPNSLQISELHKQIVTWTEESPCHQLSDEASILLGLLEKDYYGNIAACSIQALVTHIQDTGIPLPIDPRNLHPILYELCELGLVIIVNGSSDKDDIHLILNPLQLASEIHRLLFSAEATIDAVEICDKKSPFNVGIIPQDVIQRILPEYITTECLVLLQYCQKISSLSINIHFDSAEKSLLFFPGLCLAARSDVKWVTPSGNSYSTGWLARYVDTFPSLFFHNLLLRIAFHFVHAQNTGSVCHGYLRRRCVMWKSGIYWLTETGVECVVELVHHNRDLAILVKSDANYTDECTTVFNRLISVAMEAKAEFCDLVEADFFLLDSIDESNYLSDDNLFAMSDVERVFMSSEKDSLNYVLSHNSRNRMERSRLAGFQKLTQWNAIFPIASRSVLSHLGHVNSNLHILGYGLGIAQDTIESLDISNLKECKRRIVKEWLASSCDPPCWWQLVAALHDAEMGTHAEKIRRNYGM